MENFMPITCVLRTLTVMLRRRLQASTPAQFATYFLFGTTF